MIKGCSDTPIERASEIRRQLREERQDPCRPDETASQTEVVITKSKDGRILNTNKADARFTLREEDDAVVLTVKVPKYPFEKKIVASYF